jgi:hypothetical protein
VVAVTMTALVPASAEAQHLRAVVEGQYERLDRFGFGEDTERWQTSYRVDYATRIRSLLDLSSQFQFNDQWYVGRADRVRTPMGSLRLAHPQFGFFGSYRPTTVTDAKSVTTRQKELMLSGYVQRPGLPQLMGTWTRRRLEASPGIPGSVSILRDLRSTWQAGFLALRGGYGDQSRVADNLPDRKSLTDHFDMGTTAQFASGPANGSLSYDFNTTRSRGVGFLHQVSRVHTTSLGSSYTFSPLTTASLAYSFRYTDTGTAGVSVLREHDGSLNFIHKLNRVVQFSGGGGVRGADVGAAREVESFVVGSATANGMVRPGWQLAAGLNHSWNWLPHDRGRPIDSFNSNSRMKLADGLEATADATVSRTARAVAAGDTLTAPVAVSLQTGAGLRATPLKTIIVTLGAQRYRAGESQRGDQLTTSSYTTGVEWRPTPRFMANTKWSQSSGFTRGEPSHGLSQSMVQWTPRPSFQATGTYARADQQVRDVNTALSASRETYGAWLVWGVTRDLRATLRYSEADPGLPSHARQVSADVSKSFGR